MPIGAAAPRWRKAAVPRSTPCSAKGRPRPTSRKPPTTCSRNSGSGMQGGQVGRQMPNVRIGEIVGEDRHSGIDPLAAAAIAFQRVLQVLGLLSRQARNPAVAGAVFAMAVEAHLPVQLSTRGILRVHAGGLAGDWLLRQEQRNVDA